MKSSVRLIALLFVAAIASQANTTAVHTTVLKTRASAAPKPQIPLPQCPPNNPKCKIGQG